MELGIASSIRTAQISGDYVEHEINKWLSQNEGVTVIDIKFSASAIDGNWNTDVLIIYRV